MPAVNIAIIMGHLGADPELSFTPSGAAKCRFRLATTRRWTSKDGQKQEETTWHSCTAWQKQGETIKEYVKKGDVLFVRGRINNWQVEAKDGTKKYGSEIIVEEFQFGGKKQSASTNDSDDDLGF